MKYGLFSYLLLQLKALIRSNAGVNAIDEVMVEGYRSTLYMLSQQKDERLWGRARMETQNVETDYYDRIGVVEEVNVVVSRLGATPENQVDHSRRAIDLQDADWGTAIDNFDRLRILMAPDGAYTMAAKLAMGRKKDDIWIAGVLGPARTGKRGTTLVNLPDSQKLVCVGETGAGAAAFNVFFLTLVGEKFDASEVEGTRHFAWSSVQKRQLLNETKATSSDFASVKALTSGQINEFMGFNFVRSERLPVTAASEGYNADDGSVGVADTDTLPAGARRCIAWIEDGIINAIGEALSVEVGKDPSIKFNNRIYVKQSVGVVRMEEVKVVECLCAE